MRIAVCISGQSRTWKIGYKNIIRYFDLKDIETDYFIHTWKTNSYVNKSPIVKDRTDEKYFDIDDEELNDIKKCFNPKLISVDEFDIEKFDRWTPMFYSFMKSVWLKRKYEMENDFVYDLVIKTRFDVNFPQHGINERGVTLDKFDIPDIEPLVVYSPYNKFVKFPYEWNYNSFYDVLFYADSPTMDIVSNLYKWYSKILSNAKYNINSNNVPIPDVEYFYGPGTLLYQYIIKYGLLPHSEISIPHYIVRKEAEELGLDGIEDWLKISEISHNFYNKLRDNGIVE